MSSDNTSLHSALSKLLVGMNLPDYKRDTEKPTNVVCLLQNLKTKNNNSVHYAQAMNLLCQLAERMNLLKSKEVKAIQETFESPPETATRVNVTPSLQQVPKGMTLYPHQKKVLEEITRTVRVTSPFP